MMSHFNDVSGDDLCLAPIPRLTGCEGVTLTTCVCHVQNSNNDVSTSMLVIHCQVNWRYFMASWSVMILEISSLSKWKKITVSIAIFTSHLQMTHC